MHNILFEAFYSLDVVEEATLATHNPVDTLVFHEIG